MPSWTSVRHLNFGRSEPICSRQSFYNVEPLFFVAPRALQVGLIWPTRLSRIRCRRPSLRFRSFGTCGVSRASAWRFLAQDLEFRTAFAHRTSSVQKPESTVSLQVRSGSWLHVAVPWSKEWQGRGHRDRLSHESACHLRWRGASSARETGRGLFLC